jgi:myosin heavy subunit
MGDLTELVVGVEDMIVLQQLSEETLLQNLELRYSSNLIYVRNLQ